MHWPIAKNKNASWSNVQPGEIRLGLYGITVICFLICPGIHSWSYAQDDLKPVATGIEMHPNKRITAGDDIVVFGTGGFSGVDYMVPSTGNSKAMGLPNGDKYHASSFAVAGKKIALVENFQVTIFDTESQTAFKIPIDKLRLTTVPGPLHARGHMQSDGDFIICRSDRSTTDTRLIKIIDLRRNKPGLISFADNPPVIRADFINHVLVNAKSNIAVAATQDSFFIYDIKKTDAAPITIKVDGGIADLPPQLDGNKIVFQDREAFPNTKLLDISTKKITQLAHNPSAGVLGLKHGAICYFVKTNSNDQVGNGIRSAIGRVDKLKGIKLATERKFINGRTANHGAVGYGETVAISEQGNLWFLAGLASVGSGEYLQVSNGGEFRLLSDPLGKDKHGCYATDVTLCNRTVAFKTKGKDHRASYVGYLVLPATKKTK